MDSTSICFLASADVSRLLTLRMETEDPADDDRVWAARAAEVISGCEHLSIPREERPMWFAGLSEPDDLEGPNPFVRTRSVVAATAAEVAARGATMHLTGHGGDELCYVTPQQLHDLFPAHPFQTLGHVRAGRAVKGWRTRAVIRRLLDRSSFASWLEASSRLLTAPRPKVRAPRIGWGVDVRMPPWATPEAAATAADLMRRTAAARPEPLSPSRTQHSTLQNARIAGTLVRRMNRATTLSGVPWHAPFLDDRVLEVALTTRYADWSNQDGYKPVLSMAMRGTVPDHILDRPTKAEFSAEAFAGLRRNRRDLLDLCDDMRLADLGFVDPDAFRSAVVGLHTSPRTVVPLDGTLACETWLRSVEAAAPTILTDESAGAAARGGHR
jgi:asparagine synthase (glutamine-hydrolysing)